MVVVTKCLLVASLAVMCAAAAAVEADQLHMWPCETITLEGARRHLGDKKLTLKCVSDRPRVFVIDDFMSEEETHVLNKATETQYRAGHGEKSGYRTGHQGYTISAEEKRRAASNTPWRVSESLWMPKEPGRMEVPWGPEASAVLHKVNRRVADAARLPLRTVERGSDDLQVIKYSGGQGYYLAHYDSLFLGFLANKVNAKEFHGSSDARFVTVLYYLRSDPGLQGGATCFPWAGKTCDALSNANIFDIKNRQSNTSHWHSVATRGCVGDNEVLVKPKRGRAVLWYNHFVTAEGLLGEMDPCSLHLACDVKRGVKVAGNHWVRVPAVRWTQADTDNFQASLQAQLAEMNRRTTQDSSQQQEEL